MARDSRRDMPRSRRQPFREPRTRILVLCCGKRTEPEYFSGLVKHVRSTSVSVKIKTGTSDPAGLVAQAKTFLDTGDFDQLWCVVDVDHFDIDLAVASVRDEPRIRLAISNPCFELWLLLHFQDHSAHLPKCAKAAKLLSRHVPGYEKSVVFRTYEPGLSESVERARKLNSADGGHPNPSTDVWRLVELIMNEGERRRPGRTTPR